MSAVSLPDSGPSGVVGVRGLTTQEAGATTHEANYGNFREHPVSFTASSYLKLSLDLGSSSSWVKKVGRIGACAYPAILT